MGLDVVSVNSLKGVNAWLGVINSNLQGSSRTAYRKIRPSLTDGLGANSILTKLELPTVTFTVQSTSYDWDEPGNILASTSSSHFALNGQGYFILADKLGRYYASRDGEFHWAPDGYLVNSAGLRVVSTGQDFIRLGQNDLDDLFRSNGASHNLQRYGNKTMMIASFENLNNLTMSQYGSTVFSLNGALPFNLRNDFRRTVDGLTYIYDDRSMSTASFNGVGPAPVAPTYTHNTTVSFANGMSGFVDVVAGGNENSTARMILGQSQKTRAWDFQTDFNLDQGAGAPNGWMAINFGQTAPEHQFTDTTADSGYQIRYSTAGVVQVYQAVRTGQPPILLFTGALPVPVTTASATLPTRLGITFKDDGTISMGLFNPQTGTSGNLTYKLSGNVIDPYGHMSIQNTNSNLRLHNLSVNFDHNFNPEVNGRMFIVNTYDRDEAPNVPAPPNPEVSIGIDAVSSLQAPSNPGATFFDRRRGTALVQSALESSNASLMEFLPLLSLAQKVFSGVAKTISVYNAEIDDLNGLIR